MPHLTLINSAEEDIKEYTDKQRAHGHLPTEGWKKSRWHWILLYDSGFLPLLLKDKSNYMVWCSTRPQTNTHTYLSRKRVSSTASATGSRNRAILLYDTTMLKRSKCGGVHRGLPNSEASGDPRVSLDSVCTSSPPSPVPCEASGDTPCIVIPVQRE